MLPFTFEKTIEAPVRSTIVEGISGMIIRKLTERIKAEQPSSFATNQYQITFSGGFLRLVNNWNLLVPINRGVIDVVFANGKISITYKLWFVELFIFTSLITAMFAFFILSVSAGNLVQSICAIVGIWSFLFGGNFIIAIARFDNLISSVIQNV